METSKQLLRMGHHTEIVCTNATADGEPDVIDGVRVNRYPYFYPYIGLSAEDKRILDRKGGCPFSFSLHRALKRFPNADLFHLHTGNRIGAGARTVARQRGIPYVISLHGGQFSVPAEEAASVGAQARGALDWGKALGWWYGARHVLPDAAAIICVGHQEQEAAQKALPDKRVVYFPNGVDVDRFSQGDGRGFREQYGIPRDAQVLLTVARIDSQKNQLLAVRVLPELLKRAPKLHVVLVGHVTNQGYVETIEHTARDGGVMDHLTIIPGLEGGGQALVDAYHAADVFLLPSIHEPFGIVALEAWAAGLPVVASRIGGLPYFIEAGKDGELFDPRDESELMDALLPLLENPDRRRALAEAGAAKARNEYGWDTITSRLVELYEDVIRNHRR